MNNTLLDNSEKFLMRDILREFIGSGRYNHICIATGYWDLPGTALVYDQLKTFLEAGGRLDILLGQEPQLRSYQTHVPESEQERFPDFYLQRDINLLTDEYKPTAELIQKYCCVRKYDHSICAESIAINIEEIEEQDDSQIQIRVFGQKDSVHKQFLHAKCYIFLGPGEAFKQISATIRDTVLCDVLVCRTRTDIKNYYAEDMEKQHLVFPTISGPHSLKYKMDDELAQLFADTMNLISPTENFKFNNSDNLCYYRYRAIQYLTKLEDLQKYQGRGSRDPEKVGEQLAKIMQILLVKRLESSFSAFTQSLLNLRNYTANMIRMWENNAIFICPQFDVNAELDEKAKTEKRGHKVAFAECADDIRVRIKKLNEKGKNEKEQKISST